MTQDAGVTFALLLQRYRLRAGLTQEALAEQAQLSVRGISDLERGVRQLPRKHTRQLLAAALQLGAEDRAAFERAARKHSEPPASTPAPASRHARLPTPPTPLIGRDAEVATVRALLQRSDLRLVTLSGTGGVGKTRVALQVAAEVQADFADGAVFVALQAIRDPDLVLSAIAQTLGVTTTGGEPLEQRLKSYLRDQHLLLVLDNVEHLLPAAPHVAGLLADATQVKVLVTSRAPLHLQGEHEVPVPPLAVPDVQQRGTLSLAALGQFPAIALFVARAQGAKPTFALTDENARTVVELCARLDGLPLAIELAASRSKLLPPQAMLARLSDRLTLLRGGAVDADPKHHTLRATLDWSYDLLTADEQTLFARLAVFVGGCTIAAAEAVCNVADDGPIDVLDGLHSLLDKNLLYAIDGVDGEPRLSMLEMIGVYAQERLLRSGEADTIRRAHAAYYLALAEQAEPELTGPHQVQWLDRLEQEHANLRAVLHWATERGDGETALRMGGALRQFWSIHGHYSEGRQWLAAALAQGTEQPAALRAKALGAASMLATQQSDFGAARALLEERLSLARATSDTAGAAAAVRELGRIAVEQGDYGRATALLEESLTLHRALHDTGGIATALNILACVALEQGDLGQAAPLFQESLALRRQDGDLRGIAVVLNNLGLVAIDQGDYVRAADLQEENLTLRRHLGDTWGTALALNNLGRVAQELGNSTRAVALYEESLALARELRANQSIAEALDGLGSAALHQGDATRAMDLFTNSLALFRVVGDARGSAWVLTNLARAAQVQGDITRALELYQESLALAWSLPAKRIIAASFEGLATVAAAQEHATCAVRLGGVAAALREAIGMPLPPSERAWYEPMLTTVRAHLDADTFAAVWAAGQRMPLEQAVAYAQASPTELLAQER